MADRRRAWNTEDDLPVYLARPGSAAQTPRQKYGGMFAAVEGAYENKTIDFDAYSVGRRGSARTPRGAGQLDAVGLPGPGGSEDTASDVSEPSGSAISSPGERDERPPALCIRCPAPRDLPLGRDNGQVPSGLAWAGRRGRGLGRRGLGSPEGSAEACVPGRRRQVRRAVGGPSPARPVGGPRGCAPGRVASIARESRLPPSSAGRAGGSERGSKLAKRPHGPLGVHLTPGPAFSAAGAGQLRSALVHACIRSLVRNFTAPAVCGSGTGSGTCHTAGSGGKPRPGGFPREGFG